MGGKKTGLRKNGMATLQVNGRLNSKTYLVHFHLAKAGNNRTEPRHRRWWSANSIVQHAVGSHFTRICVIFTIKEEQRDVIRFLVAVGVEVTLDHLCAAIKAKRSGLLSSGVAPRQCVEYE
ncbi:hypothetical protein AVEN_63161-1 [Araneus ventricosus]|uniref:Uncharacterized protein n=1 Tax=Araneus ventricosus TaxID=182803 RepID=A0A4Y2B1E4_ARAVE|nr:hypothetical protein AVEN_63161-1 [Araneus ventricosus]